VDPGTTTVVDIELATLGCELSDVRSIWVWFSGGAVFDIDHVRAQ
jgi:hypothetical protein